MKLDGEVVTGRNCSRIREVKPILNGDILTISAQGMIDLNIDLKRFTTSDKKESIDVGENSAVWFSRFLLQEDFGHRMIFQTSSPDEPNFTLINENSVTDLDYASKLSGHFRPNFVVKGATAFEETEWTWLKIGDDAIFKTLKANKSLGFINTETAESPKEQLNQCLKMHLKKPGKIKFGDAVYTQDKNFRKFKFNIF